MNYVVVDEEILGAIFPNGIQVIKDHPRFCGSNRAIIPLQNCRPATKNDFEKFNVVAPKCLMPNS